MLLIGQAFSYVAAAGLRRYMAGFVLAALYKRQASANCTSSRSLWWRVVNSRVRFEFADRHGGEPTKLTRPARLASLVSRDTSPSEFSRSVIPAR